MKTTIPLQKETRDKIREFAKKSETWDEVLNRLYENAISVETANILFTRDSMSSDEALREIEKW